MTPTEPRYISAAEAAERIGVSTFTIRRMITRGELTGYKFGPRLLRIDQRELDSLLTPIPTVGTIGGAR